jgi:hypothetical protein
MIPIIALSLLYTATTSSNADITLGSLAGTVCLFFILDRGSALTEGDNADGDGRGEDDEAGTAKEGTWGWSGEVGLRSVHHLEVDIVEFVCVSATMSNGQR